MRQHKSYRPRRHLLVAKAAKQDRSSEAGMSAGYLLLVTGLLVGQLLLLIGP